MHLREHEGRDNEEGQSRDQIRSERTIQLSNHIQPEEARSKK